MKISVSMRFVAVMLVVFTVTALAFAFFSVAGQRRIYDEHRSVSGLADDLYGASSAMTEQLRWYVNIARDDRDEYYRAYTETAAAVDRVYDEIVKMRLPADFTEIMLHIRTSFDDIKKYESDIFKSAGEDDVVGARSMLFSGEYTQYRNWVNEAITILQQRADARFDENLQRSLAVTGFLLFSVLALSVGGLVIVLFCFSSIDEKNGNLKEMTELASLIAAGDFSVDLGAYEKEGEFGEMSKILGNIHRTVEDIEKEIIFYVENILMGNLIYKAETAGFKGYWINILEGINTAVQCIREKVIENAPIVYIIIQDGCVVDCNRYAREKIGIAIGAFIESYYENPEQRKTVIGKLESDKEVLSEQVVVRTKDGDKRRYSIFVYRIGEMGVDTHIVWAVDVENEERQHDIIRSNQNDLKKMIDALPIITTITDPETGDIEYANTAFYICMCFNSRPDEVNERELFGPEQRDGVSAAEKEKKLLNRLSETKAPVSEEFTYRALNGEDIETRVTASEVVYENKRCVVKMIQDIAEEKRYTDMLKSAAEKEREANQLKSRFLANMSHEIRTPMNAIIGFTQIALTRCRDQQDIETYRKINSSAKNLLTIINDILDFSKIEAQKLDLVEEKFALEDITSNAFMVASERIEDKKIEMLLDIDPRAPYYLVGDKTRLWQVLKNLLDNSAKYTKSGSVVLRIYPANADENNVDMVFKIIDTGIGMTKRQLDKLFVPFTQFSDNFKYKTSGTGLGMSITKQLVELMGGTIKIVSAPDKGSEVTVNIKFAFDEDRSTLLDALRKNPSAGHTVLIADDDPVSLEIMEKLCLSAGFLPVCVSSGKEALAQASERGKAGRPFDIIILDYLLGEDDGIEIGRELMKNQYKSKLLMVSAYVRKIPEDKIREVGFKDVLQKPIIPGSFVRRLCDTITDNFPDAPKPPLFENASVLLCEDNVINQEVATQLLEILGIKADVAENGAECLEMLQKKSYDLILMDIQMPVMDGKEATRRIRESGESYKDVRILAMTANVMAEQVSEFGELGVDGYVPKPVELERLSGELAKYLSVGAPAADAKPPPERGGDGVSERGGDGVSIEGVLTGEGLARFGGDAKRYKKSLLSFALEPVGYPAPEKSDGFDRYIHTVKGAAGNLGITRLAELAEDVEDSVKSGDDKALFDCYAEFKAQKEIVGERIIAAIPDI
ncbi:MAG: response regulator [Oscillospiraceae bacterium]|jgi:signal transduction histidine kinase/CheY-like chemotaxis protein|nr:response regulator [Oscillospiraceae bacterium]